ncbi:kinase-like domain-containing protein [Phlyctochytrium arcticum]|nr:kinase-like domain-containing protein [Phlyctochytrium arcticum]
MTERRAGIYIPSELRPKPKEDRIEEANTLPYKSRIPLREGRLRKWVTTEEVNPSNPFMLAHEKWDESALASKLSQKLVVSQEESLPDADGGSAAASGSRKGSSNVLALMPTLDEDEEESEDESDDSDIVEHGEDRICSIDDDREESDREVDLESSSKYRGQQQQRIPLSAAEQVSSEATLDMASFGSPSQSQNDMILPMPAEAADPTRAEAASSNKRRSRWLPGRPFIGKIPLFSHRTRGEKSKLEQSLHRPELPSSAANNDITVQDLLVMDQHPRESSVEPATAEVRSRWNRLRKAPKRNAASVPSDRQHNKEVPLLRRLWHVRKVKAATTMAPTSEPLENHRKLQHLLPKIHSKIFRKRSSLTDEELASLPDEDRFESKYTVVRNLGTGGHSTVRLGERNSDGKLFVCKFIKETTVWHWKADETSPTGRIPLEVHVMRHLRDHGENEGVIKFEEFFSMDPTFIIVMEYLGDDWCDLYELIEQWGMIDEDTAADIFGQVVENVAFVHYMGWYHNDIKDENILINHKTLDVKLIDFGSATPLTPHTVSSFYGTRKFASPEAIYGEPYLPEAQEVWALGNLLFIILFKVDPFNNDEAIVETPILDCIAHQQRRRQREDPSFEVPTNVVRLLEGMLEKDWTKRWTMQKVMDSAWLTSRYERRRFFGHYPC